MRRVVVALAAFSTLALAAVLAPAAGAAESGRVAVGVERGSPIAPLAAAIEAATGQPVSLELLPLGVLVAATDDPPALASRLATSPGVRYAEVVRARRLAFVPNDPLAPSQWHLAAVRAFDAWPEVPALAPVLVAVVDSGVDAGHPEFAGRIEAARSFVATSAEVDSVGHGTMVAGEIAAATGNAEGVAGVGLPVRLLVAKVVGSDGTISLEAEAKAIRWAVDRGARVINLSLGGQRDPDDPDRDTFSQLEADAVAYAVGRGAVVVAATGNCETDCPYRYASYPAALPHVLGVGAIGQDGRVPVFSNRDELFADVVAPGVGILSTFPRELGREGCEPVGYSLCAPDEYARGEGTSFAAPIASAAAALVLATRPELTPDQVIQLLQATAADVLRPGVDRASGHGRLDVAAAVATAAAGASPADAFEINRGLEVNEDAGTRAFPLYFGGGVVSRTIAAGIDASDDPTDVYRVRLARRQQLTLTLRGPFAGGDPPLASPIELSVHAPGTTTLAGATPLLQRTVTAGRARVSFTAASTGWYYVALEAGAGGGSYRLAVARSGVE